MSADNTGQAGKLAQMRTVALSAGITVKVRYPCATGADAGVPTQACLLTAAASAAARRFADYTAALVQRMDAGAAPPTGKAASL